MENMWGLALTRKINDRCTWWVETKIIVFDHYLNISTDTGKKIDTDTHTDIDTEHILPNQTLDWYQNLESDSYKVGYQYWYLLKTMKYVNTRYFIFKMRFLIMIWYSCIRLRYLLLVHCISKQLKEHVEKQIVHKCIHRFR